MNWLLATTNPGKVLELRHILAPYGIAPVGLADCGITAVCPETGMTFWEDAEQKARFYHQMSGLPTLADDSGLEVDSLGGAPGIHSARFGGFSTDIEKYTHLLDLLEEVAPERRSARFRCAATFCDDRHCLTVEACLEGVIGTRPKGRGGFGYDPVFYLSLDGPSLAQIEAAEKNALSHRGKAFRSLLTDLHLLHPVKFGNTGGK